MVTVVKCGGTPHINADEVAADLAALMAKGEQVVLVLGGASDIGALGGRLGVTTRTLVTPDGQTRRYTSGQALEVLTMAMTGIVQPRWLTALGARGISSVALTGLDGGCLRARRTPVRRAVADGRTVVIRDDHSGRMSEVNTGLLDTLLAAGYLPVLGPPAVAEDGRPVNVNADRLAAAVAAQLGASALIMLTAAPGLLRDPADEATLIERFVWPARAQPPDCARDGMALKLVAAREALIGGVGTVMISDGRGTAPLRRALDGAGTAIVPGRPAPAVAASDDGVVGLLKDMIAIPSPSGAERRLASYLVGAMSRLGLTARLDEAGNVIGTTGRSAGPVVLLAGHMDTVPGPTALRLEGGLMFGRGASDAKGPLAAMITAAAMAGDFPGTIIVAGLVEEETPQSRGATHLRKTLPQPDALIVGEPGRWENVIIGYKGKLDLVYKLSRPATHPTNPEAKATEAAMDFWREAVAAAGPRLDHATFGLPALTLCEMSGDISAARLRLSYRTPPGYDHDGLVARLCKAAGDGEVEVENAVSAVRTSRSNPVVRALFAAIRGRQGRPAAVLKTATSDMNTLAEAWSCPMATYGPGDNRLGHASTEHIEIDDLLAGVSVLRAALGELATLGRQE
jgi:LysW-gamma-L-lysine carboxypeptidase